MKKRKSQEKAREEQSAEREKKRKVCLGIGSLHNSSITRPFDDGDDIYKHATRPLCRCCRYAFNHLSGLNRPRSWVLRSNAISRC